MRVKEDIRPISYVKTHTANVVAQVNSTRRPVFVTQNGKAKAVMVDALTYENMKMSLGLLKLISQGEKDILRNNFKKQSDLFNLLDRKYLKK